MSGKLHAPVAQHCFRRFVTGVLSISLVIFLFTDLGLSAQDDDMLIDDFTNASLVSKLDTRWESVSDRVMGGVSRGVITHQTDGDENCMHLKGEVRLENNGGFVQAALDLKPDGGTLDASQFTGIRLLAKGNGEQYSVHLRTPDNRRPWQSYRAHFVANSEMEAIEFPFSQFEPHRTEEALDVSRLRRMGLVAIGREFQADLTLCRVEFYR